MTNDVAGDQPESRGRHRTDVQGLRAVAIGLVVLGHYLPDWLPGGFVGVDIFFVISGYLVAGPLLLRAIDRQPVRVGDFFARRLRRILPAASVWAAITAAFFIWWDALLREAYRSDALAALFFFANFRASDEPGGYFSVVNPSPFRHYWSLAVEEQFYLLMPVAALAVVVLRLGRRSTIGAVLALTMLSCVGAFLLVRIDPQFAFFMLPARAWEFGVGAAAALVAAPRVAPRWARWVGGAGIVASALLLTHDSPVPGPLLLPAVIGTALLLWVRPADGGKLLSLAPMRWLGDHSYALYLTHWAPLVCAVIRADGGWPGPVALLVAGSVSLGAAMLLHTVVEVPLHTGRGWAPRGRGIRSVLSGATLPVALTVVLVSIPLLVHLTDDRSADLLSADDVRSAALRNPGYVADNVTPAPDAARELNELYQGCHAGDDTVTAAPCFFGPEKSRPDILVLGDSHAATISDGFRAAFPQARLAFLSRTSCPMFPPETSPSRCDQWRDSALALIPRLDPRLVVLTNYTSAYAHGESTQAYARRIQTGWRATLGSLAGRRIVVLGDVPAAPVDPPRCLARNAASARDCDFRPSAPDRELVEKERAVVTAAGVPWIDTWLWFCDTTCAVLAGNVALWRDAAGHLTPAGSELLAPRIADALSTQLDERGLS